MSERDPEDMELAELSEKVAAMAKWLDDAFGADCAEDDYCEGCASCEAGMAIKHLRNIEKLLAPFTGATP